MEYPVKITEKFEQVKWKCSDGAIFRDENKAFNHQITINNLTHKIIIKGGGN